MCDAVCSRSVVDIIQGLLHMLQLPYGKRMVYGNHHPTHECLERRLHCEGGWGEAMMRREHYNRLSDLCNKRSDLQGPTGNKHIRSLTLSALPQIRLFLQFPLFPHQPVLPRPVLPRDSSVSTWSVSPHSFDLLHISGFKHVLIASHTQNYTCSNANEC